MKDKDSGVWESGTWDKVEWDFYHQIARKGSSYQGFINARYEDLVAVFGEPRECYDGKVQVEWLIAFYDEAEDRYIPASIYDWKMTPMYWSRGAYYGCTPEMITTWHIGGVSLNAVGCVKSVLTKQIKAAA